MDKITHLIKLSVGTESVETLADWQKQRAAERPDGLPRHVTRMWPRRDAEILAGGSIYWVIKGLIQCRQRILRLDELFGDDGVRRCAIILDPNLIRTTNVQRRPFQGWRYLSAFDAPPDLTGTASNQEEPLPAELAGALAEIGVI